MMWSLFLKIAFIEANSTCQDKMPHKVAFYLGLHYSPMHQFMGYLV